MVTFRKLLGFMTLLSFMLLFSLPNQGNPVDPRVSITSPKDEGIVKGQIEIEVKVTGFADLTVSFAYFAYSRNGKRFTEIGYDRDSSDGFSIRWDTSKHEDGKYFLRATVTDTFGNKASAQTSVVINNHFLPNRGENIHSITDELIKTVGTGLVQVGTRLEFSKKEDDLFVLLNRVSAKINQAGQSLRTVAQSLVNIRADLPEAFLQMVQVEKSKIISDSFSNLAILFEQAADSTRAVDNRKFKAALGDIKSEISRLADITLAGIELTPLSTVRRHLDKVLFLSQKLDQLVEQADQQVDESKLDTFVEQFEKAFSKISRVFKEVGTGIEESASHREAKFTTPSQESINSYTQGQKLILEVPGVKYLEFQLFDRESRLVFSKSIFGPELVWSGAGCGGQLLPAGLYYYRVSSSYGEGGGVEIGWLIVSPK